MSKKCPSLFLWFLALLVGWPAGIGAKADPIFEKCEAIEPSAEPFWRKKEKLQTRLREDKAILVSVKSVDQKERKFKHALDLQGAGIADVPLDFAYAQARRFEDYPQMSDMIKSARYDAGQSILDMTTGAFGYRADLKMKLDFREPEGGPKDIRFCVFDGVFRGLSGVIRLEDRERRKTEISMTARMGFEKLPIPEFFVRFGLEVALQAMASRMRLFVERAYQTDGQGLKKDAPRKTPRSPTF